MKQTVLESCQLPTTNIQFPIGLFWELGVGDWAWTRFSTALKTLAGYTGTHEQTSLHETALGLTLHALQLSWLN